MSRVPEIERELLRAAQRQAARASTSPRWPRRMLIAAAAALATSGVALAASGLLQDGDPVPRSKKLSPLTTPPGERLIVAQVRAPDPSGGPDWGIGTFDAALATRPGSQDIGLRCVVVARVQHGRLGVIGRDGAFQNDGRFHALVAGSDFSGGCSGTAAPNSHGFVQSFSGPLVPASGYSGAPGGRIGGCRERVNLDGPTVSPQTRRKLRNVPICATASLRRVVSGYAGRDAQSVTIRWADQQRVQQVRTADDGAYLFVLPRSVPRPTVEITLRDGTTCALDQRCTGH